MKKVNYKADVENFYMYFGPWYTFASAQKIDRWELIYMDLCSLENLSADAHVFQGYRLYGLYRDESQNYIGGAI